MNIWHVATYDLWFMATSGVWQAFAWFCIYLLYVRICFTLTTENWNNWKRRSNFRIYLGTLTQHFVCECISKDWIAIVWQLCIEEVWPIIVGFFSPTFGDQKPFYRCVEHMHAIAWDLLNLWSQSIDLGLQPLILRSWWSKWVFFSLYQVRLLEVATWNTKLRLSEAEVGRKVYHHL